MNKYNFLKTNFEQVNSFEFNVSTNIYDFKIILNVLQKW